MDTAVALRLNIREAVMKLVLRAILAGTLFLGWSNALSATDRVARASLFDAHLHYNGEARARFSVAQTLAQLQAEGVGAVIATSTPNDGTHELARAAAGGSVAVIPFLRPYRTDADRATWFKDPAIASFVDDELARDGSYRGIGEFHIHGGADASGVVMKHIVDVAVARGFWLHAHCDDAALEAIFGHDARVKVIWAHSGFTTPPAKIAAYLARYPTLMAELSYRTDIASGAKVSPAWRELLTQYPDRFLLGSDTWTNEQWSSYGQIIDAYRAWLTDLPRETAENLLGGNGARMFGVPRRDDRALRVSAAEPRYSRGLLFRLERPGVPASYVFGTLHSNDGRVAVLAPPVRAAFDSARRVAFENVLADADETAFFAAAQYEDGRRLADAFDVSTLERIRHALGPRAPPEAQFERLKPWAVLLLLAQPRIDEGGPTLDRQLLAEARRRKLTVLALEDLDEEVAALDTVPLDSQVALVHWALNRRVEIDSDQEAAIAAWRDRDLAGLDALARKPGKRDPALAPHLTQLSRQLIEGRSALMAHRLFLPLIEGRVFVAVGALHLYGEKGLLAMLEEQGYRVRRVY